MSTGICEISRQKSGLRMLTEIGEFETGGGGAADWVINDIIIGGRSQLLSQGDIPGDIFATGQIDNYLSLDVVPSVMDVRIRATNIGRKPHAFYASLVGLSTDEPRPPTLGLITPAELPQARRAVLPLSNNNLLVNPGQTVEIVARPQAFAFQPQRLVIAQGTEVTRHVRLRIDGDLYEIKAAQGVLLVELIDPSKKGFEDVSLESHELLLSLRMRDGIMYGVDERSGPFVLEIGSRTKTWTEQVREYPDYDEPDYDEDAEYDEEDEAVPTAAAVIRDVERTSHEFVYRFEPDGFVPDWIAAEIQF